MAADWIKMRTDLYRDPKVCIIADHLMDADSELSRYVNQNCRCDMAVTRNVMRNVTVGALVTLWGVTRHRGKRVDDDLVIKNATVSIVDDIADLPGFGEALASVGWVKETEEGIVFPHFFEEFNTDPNEDAKAKNAERQRKYREKSNALRNVTVTSQSNAREEESREEKSNNTHTLTRTKKTQIEIPEEIAAEWVRWCEFRFAIDGRAMPVTQIETVLMDLGRRGWEKAKRDIDFSIRKNAKTIIDSDNDFEKRSRPSAPQQRKQVGI